MSNLGAAWRGVAATVAVCLWMGTGLAACGGDAGRRPEMRAVESATGEAPEPDRTVTDDPTRPKEGETIDLVEGGGAGGGPVVIEEGAADEAGTTTPTDEPAEGEAEIDLEAGASGGAKANNNKKKPRPATPVEEQEEEVVEEEAEGPAELELPGD